MSTEKSINGKSGYQIKMVVSLGKADPIQKCITNMWASSIKTSCHRVEKKIRSVCGSVATRKASLFNHTFCFHCESTVKCTARSKHKKTAKKFSQLLQKSHLYSGQNHKLLPYLHIFLQLQPSINAVGGYICDIQMGVPFFFSFFLASNVCDHPHLRQLLYIDSLQIFTVH